MFHDGSLGIEDRIGAVRSYMEFYEKQDVKLLSIYADRMKESGKFSSKPHEWITGMLKEKMRSKLDVFLDADETVEWGLADSIFDGNWRKLKG